MSTEHAPVLWANVPAGYLNADQLGLLLPAPANGPERYRFKAANLAAAVPSRRAAWAHIVVSGTCDHAHSLTFADGAVAKLPLDHDEVRIRFTDARPTDRRLAAMVRGRDRRDRRPHMTRRSTTRHRVTPPLAQRYWRHHGHRRGR